MTPTDDFDRALLEEIGNNKALQLAMLEKIQTGSKGYSIPTGGAGAFIKRLFAEHTGEELERDKLMLGKMLQLRLVDILQVFGEVQAALTAKEASGERLDAVDRTIRDIDLSALVLTAGALHQTLVGKYKHSHAPEIKVTVEGGADK